jgi:protein required for attachment to host cells
MRFRFAASILWLALMPYIGTLEVQAQSPSSDQSDKPLTLEKVMVALNAHALSSQDFMKAFEKRGVDFELTPNVEKKLREAGADADILQGIRTHYRNRTSMVKSVITNQTVIDMVAADLSRDVILAKIRSSEARFDLSVAGLVELKKQSVSPEIIQVMINPSAQVVTPSAADVEAERERMIREEAEKTEQESLARQQQEEQDRLQHEQQRRAAEAAEAARIPRWRFSQDGQIYRIDITESYFTISPVTGNLSAQIPIKVNKKGQQQIMGQWQANGYAGFISIKQISDQQITASMMIPQTQGASCISRTASFFQNMNDSMNKQNNGCASVNVFWQRQ